MKSFLLAFDRIKICILLTVSNVYESELSWIDTPCYCDASIFAMNDRTIDKMLDERNIKR